MILNSGQRHHNVLPALLVADEAIYVHYTSPPQREHNMKIVIAHKHCS